MGCPVGTSDCWVVRQVKNLSGGELQRVAITLALGTPADIYLIDEPSAYLDSEQRIIAAKVCFSSWLFHSRMASEKLAAADLIHQDPLKLLQAKASAKHQIAYALT